METPAPWNKGRRCVCMNAAVVQEAAKDPEGILLWFKLIELNLFRLDIIWLDLIQFDSIDLTRLVWLSAEDLELHLNRLNRESTTMKGAGPSVQASLRQREAKQMSSNNPAAFLESSAATMFRSKPRWWRWLEGIHALAHIQQQDVTSNTDTNSHLTLWFFYLFIHFFQ